MFPHRNPHFGYCEADGFSSSDAWPFSSFVDLRGLPHGPPGGHPPPPPPHHHHHHRHHPGSPPSHLPHERRPHHHHHRPHGHPSGPRGAHGFPKHSHAFDAPPNGLFHGPPPFHFGSWRRPFPRPPGGGFAASPPPPGSDDPMRPGEWRNDGVHAGWEDPTSFRPPFWSFFEDEGEVRSSKGHPKGSAHPPPPPSPHGRHHHHSRHGHQGHPNPRTHSQYHHHHHHHHPPHPGHHRDHLSDPARRHRGSSRHANVAFEEEEHDVEDWRCYSPSSSSSSSSSSAEEDEDYIIPDEEDEHGDACDCAESTVSLSTASSSDSDEEPDAREGVTTTGVPAEGVTISPAGEENATARKEEVVGDATADRRKGRRPRKEGQHGHKFRSGHGYHGRRHGGGWR